MPYENPTRTPYVGGYTWVPKGPPTGDATASSGFKQPVNAPGEIRNDLPYDESYNRGTLDISFKGNVASTGSTETSPIFNSFRFLQRQSSYRNLPPSTPFILTGDFSYTITIRNPRTISGIELEYSLGCLLSDTAFDDLITDDAQKELLNISRSSGTIHPDFKIENILPCQILLDGVEYPLSTFTNLPKELPITTFYTERTAFINAENYVYRSIRFGNSEFLTTGFPSPSKIEIKVRTSSSAIFKLRKLSLFNPIRANLDKDQLPASLISYAFPILFKVGYTFANLSYPSSFKNRGTVNVKVYPRNYLTYTSGFAHSINLRFLIASFAIISIDPFSLLSGVGINSTPGLYFFWFLGLWPERRNLKFQLSSQYFSYYDNSRIVKLFKVPLPERFELHKTKSDTQPNNNAEYTVVENSKKILKYKDINKNKSFYDEGPFVDDYTQGYARPFTFLDLDSSDNTWYRVSSDESNGEWIAAEKHYETNPLYLTKTQVGSNLTEIERKIYLPNNNLADNTPIALFVSDTTYNINRLDINKDSFKILLEAKKNDPNEYSFIHLYYRIWFVPENYQVDITNIDYYQQDYEIKFVTQSGKTILEKGKPTSLEECIVTPPLSNTYQKFSMTRYVNNDSTIGTDVGFFTNPKYIYNIDGSPVSDNWKMCLAVYAITYPNPSKNPGYLPNYYDYPSVTIRINPSFSAVETAFNYVKSTQNTLEASKLPQFTSIEDEDYPRVSLVNCYTGNIKSPKTIDGYKSLATFPSSVYVNNAFKKILNLKTSQDIDAYKLENVKVNIPLNSINVPAEFTNTSFVEVDFCTDGPLLMRGQIKNGTWTIDHEFDEVSNCKLQLDVFAVGYDGQIVFNIYKSDYFDTTSKQTIFNINIPFLLPETNCQIVFRLRAYPFSSTTSLSLNSLVLSKHTIQMRTLTENDSAGGSVAFYEDLPLTPTQSLDENSFWFKASDDIVTTGPVLSDSNGEFTVSGCLYSPTWMVDLPLNTDVDYYTYGLGTNPILFRTVTSKAAAVSSISATKNDLTKDVTVSYTSESTTAPNSTTTEILNVSNTQNNYKKQYVVKQGEKYLQGTNSNLITSNRIHNSPKANTFLLAENDGFQGKDIVIAANLTGMSEEGWGSYQGNFNRYNFDNNYLISTGLYKTSVKVSNLLPLVYIAGLAQPGSVVLKVAPLNFSNKEVPNSNNYLIDGPNVDYTSNFPQLTYSEYNTIKAKDLPPAVIYDKYGNVFVFYIMSDKAYKILGRMVSNDRISSKYTILDLSKYFGNVKSDYAINGFDAYYDEKRNLIHFAIHLKNSIYYFSTQIMKPNSLYISGIENLHFVAGDTGENNSILTTLNTLGRVFIDPSATTDKNIPAQKPSIIALTRADKIGKVMIWYKDGQNQIVSKEIIPQAQTFKPNAYKRLS